MQRSCPQVLKQGMTKIHLKPPETTYNHLQPTSEYYFYHCDNSVGKCKCTREMLSIAKLKYMQRLCHATYFSQRLGIVWSLFSFFLSPRRYLFLQFKCSCYSVKGESLVISAKLSVWVLAEKPAKNVDRLLKYSNLSGNFFPKEIRKDKEINRCNFSFVFGLKLILKGT